MTTPHEQTMRDALQLALNEIKALIAYSGGGLMTDRTLAAIKQALADEPAKQHQDAPPVKPVQPVNEQLLEALKGMVAIQDEPFKLQGLYGKAMDKAIQAQCERVEQRVQVARAAIEAAKGVR